LSTSKQVDNISTFEAILIIPESSCGICVEQSIAFLVKNLKAEKGLLGIITSFTSAKNLTLQYSGLESIMKNNRFILDIDKAISNGPLKINAPILLFLSKGTIVNLISVKPSNLQESLKKFQTHLTKKHEKN
jgi:hypothetical protein